MEKLIRALRCSTNTNLNGFECDEDCPYRKLNEMGQDILTCCQPDVIIDGIDYYISCDYDRMKLDAADALEKLQKFQWVPVKIRPTTEEDEIDMQKYQWYLDFPLPEGGERILVSRNGYVDTDENRTYDGISHYLDGWGDWVDVDAWMPLPEPYKGVENDIRLEEKIRK